MHDNVQWDLLHSQYLKHDLAVVTGCPESWDRAMGCRELCNSLTGDACMGSGCVEGSVHPVTSYCLYV